jgi:predicted nucleic acid-binding protein
MLVALDTSVLVAGALRAHPAHARVSVWQQAINRDEIRGMACLHALAETYSVLTKIPGGLSPAESRVVVNRIRRRLRIALPTADTYLAAMARCEARSLRSGAIYDALHLIAAECEGADALLTLNPDDFTRLSEGERPTIAVPPDPPSLDLM